MTASDDATFDVFRQPVIMTGSHEPLSFRRRTGYARADEEAIWLREHAPATIAALARRGITGFRAHFFRGSGSVHLDQSTGPGA